MMTAQRILRIVKDIHDSTFGTLEWENDLDSEVAGRIALNVSEALLAELADEADIKTTFDEGRLRLLDRDGRIILPN